MEPMIASASSDTGPLSLLKLAADLSSVGLPACRVQSVVFSAISSKFSRLMDNARFPSFVFRSAQWRPTAKRRPAVERHGFTAGAHGGDQTVTNTGIIVVDGDTRELETNRAASDIK